MSRPNENEGLGVEDRLLMIDDDAELAAMVRDYLGEAGFGVDLCPDVQSGLSALNTAGREYSLLLLDLMLPDGDGLEVCRKLRAGDAGGGHRDLPILMLTARGDETDRILGLELGADDYLPKPFHPRELLARIRAVLRRGPRSAEPEGRLRFGRLTIDPGTRRVAVDGEEKDLTGHQFDLLCLLAERPGRVWSRDAIMQRLRGSEAESFDRSIDVHISRIRSEIEDDPKKPRRILTIRGTGYVFASRQDESSS